MKKLLIVLGIVVASLLCVAVFKNLIIKSIVTTAATRIVGAPVHMDGFSLNIFSSTIHISGFKIYNPGGFPEGVLVSCPKIKIIYDRATLFKHERHFFIAEVELKEMGLTKNKEGKFNVDSLKIVKHSEFSPPVPMQVDLLTISIGKVVYKDYAAGTEPSVRVYDVNAIKSYKGIPSAEQLALLVLAEPMKTAGITGAAIYGAAMLTGPVALPVLAAATLIGKDSVQQVVDIRYDRMYKVSLEVVGRMGTVTGHDVSKGVIQGNINGTTVALILKKDAGNKTDITISARKFMFPQLDIAGGVLYQILDKLQ